MFIFIILNISEAGRFCSPVMLSLQELETQLRTHDSIVLFIGGKIICGCGKQLTSLASLAEHISRCHNRLERSQAQEDDGEGSIQEYFR